MANARLKLAREKGRKRRRSDVDLKEDVSAEVLVPSTASDSQYSAQEEPEKPLVDDGEQEKATLLQRKSAIETRLSELAVGKPLQRIEERGYDANGVRIERTHRDFLLQEMEWMAADFAQERKWRMKTARTLSVSILSHHSKKASRSARQEKMEGEARRRAAARVGREVKKFWTKIDKIISFKVKLQSDELRKAAMDRHLKNLVAQTEKYASALADAFCDPAPSSMDENDVQDGGDNVDDETMEDKASDDSDYKQEEDEEQVDDETTIEEEETMQDTGHEDYEDELAALQREGEMTVEELRAMYAAEDTEVEQTVQVDGPAEESSVDDSDFSVEDEEPDDETTIDADEKAITQRDVDEEVERLREEGEMTIEELRARYAAVLDEEDQSEVDLSDDRLEPESEAQVMSDEGDYCPSDNNSVDDETTLEIAERDEFTRDEVDEEVRLLQDESEMPIEELRAKYARADEINEDTGSQCTDNQQDGEDGDSDFCNDGTDEEDDETTIAEAELVDARTKEDVDEEISALEEEGSMSIEELRARYCGDSDPAEQSSPCESLQSAKDSEETSDVCDSTGASDNDSDHDVETVVHFKRPYLLTSRLQLREYQQAGVNWLVSMCEKRINGILADEMGLGKTIQTISLLAHLASVRGVWGPHLIVVPTSCMVNWEMEFKRWCPAFKILTYFGSAKRRKELRHGWSKQNAFHVCITSYQLVVQDAHCFKRKKWYYLILDEAHNIKNWKSLRWQTLLHFNSQRRLLLTGTPLQNNIMELWSLMHFLMPHVFASRKEFTYWFQNPLSVMVEESSGATSTTGEPINGEPEGQQQQQLVAQLHSIIRPFVLRRLKKDVAKQLPAKYEHVVTCSLSKRQRFLYEDFISRSSTRRALYGKGSGGNFMSMMNVLMQLRKVCNHPDLFEPRPISSPFDMDSITIHVPTRCGFVFDWLEKPSTAWWPAQACLPNQELDGGQKDISERRRNILWIFDDVSITTDLPSDCTAPSSSRPDALRRLLALAEVRRTYWAAKRADQGLRMRISTNLHEPMLGSDLIRACTMPVFISHAMDVHAKRAMNDSLALGDALVDMVPDPEQRVHDMLPVIRKAVCAVPKARARPLSIEYVGSGFSSDPNDRAKLSRRRRLEEFVHEQLKPIASRCLDTYYESFKRTQLFFPDKRLIQFDCGKLQQLDLLLRELKKGGHRCLIFTQMSSMLNILEIFLNLHGHTYFRLDGSTKVETRQYLMERFNHDDKVFCFILSTRSGGLGINLTGADSVIFYDSDWNPAMDAQAQDRAHRIGQTRDVHIYRLVSEHTVEENILKKAQQKRHLDFLVMAKGQFTTEFFSKASLRELMGGLEQNRDDQESTIKELEDGDDNDVSLDAIEQAMAQLEDEDDVVAMRGAREEFLSEQREFDEENNATDKRRVSNAGTEASRTSTPPASVNGDGSREELNDDRSSTVEEDASSTASLTGDAVQAHPSSELREEIGGEVESVEDDNEDEQEEEEEEEDDDNSDVEDSDDDISDEDEPKRRKNRKSAGKKRGNSCDVRGNRPAKKIKRHNLDPEFQAAQKAAQDVKKQERAKEKAREIEEERKLQAWKESVSSLQNFEDSLNPVDRYALHFREDIDPLFAYVPSAEAYKQIEDAAATTMVNIEEIEAQKMVEEQQWIAEGELIAGVSGIEELSAEEVEMHRLLYKKEKANVHASRRQRQLTGEAWEIRKCAVTGQPFYYNNDTREASWDKPVVWSKNEQCSTARAQGYAGLPSHVLLSIFKALDAYPDRMALHLVCKSWHEAALHPSLCVRVNASDFFHLHDDGRRREYWRDLLGSVKRGETLLFGSGVYEIHDVVEVVKPIRFLAVHDAHVELQMTTPRAQIKWTARGGLLCGFHLSRRHTVSHVGIEEPKNHWQHLLHVTMGGYVRAVFNDFDGNHQGNSCLAVTGDTRSLLVLQHNRIFHSGSGSGILLLQGALVMQRNSVFQNAHSGVTVWSGNALLRRNQIYSNRRFGIRLLYHANNVIVEENKVEGHPCGNIDVENSGRRFVVRWNEMLKDDVDDLPHHHGQLRLITAKIEERILPTVAKTKPTPTPALAKPPTSALLKPDEVVARPLLTKPVIPFANYMFNMRSTGPLAAIPNAIVANAAMTTVGADPLPQRISVVTPTITPITLVAGSVTPALVIKAPPASSTPTASAMSEMTTPLAATVLGLTGASGVGASGTATPVPVKIKRKRKPKTEKVLVHGVEMVFQDTCEKKGEKKVKKPRRQSSEAMKVNVKVESADSHPEPTEAAATSEVATATSEVAAEEMPKNDVSDVKEETHRVE